MDDRMNEIVHHIFQHVHDEGDVVLYEERITRSLLAAGYDNVQISSVFSWLKKMNLGDGWEITDGMRACSSDPARMPDRPDRTDRLYMSPEAFGLLKKLDNSGIIDGRMHDSILDLAMQLPIEEISVGTVKTLTAIVMLLKHHHHAEEHLLGMVESDEGELLH